MKKLIITAVVFSFAALQASAQTVDKSKQAEGTVRTVSANSADSNQPGTVVTENKKGGNTAKPNGGGLYGTPNRERSTAVVTTNAPSLYTAPGDPNAKSKKSAPNN